MNCLDFRRICLVEPSSRDPRILIHLYHCSCCKSFRKRLLAAENEMHAAMQVDVPDSLGRKIVFDTEMQSYSEPQGFRWQMFAAGMVMAVALGVGLATYTVKRNVVPVLAMHIADDPLHMSPPQADAKQRLDQVMRHLGGTWVGDKPAFTHAKVCLVKERAAAHLVVAGVQGPVTVFLIPNLSAAKREDVAVDGQVAAVHKLGKGSMALFGYPGENLDVIASRFSQSVQWTRQLANLSEQITLAGK